MESVILPNDSHKRKIHYYKNIIDFLLLKISVGFNVNYVFINIGKKFHFNLKFLENQLFRNDDLLNNNKLTLKRHLRKSLFSGMNDPELTPKINGLY